MKKSLALLLPALLAVGCSKTEDSNTTSNSQKSSIKLSDFEGIHYYEIDLNDEENSKKIIRPKYNEALNGSYTITDENYYNEIHDYGWFYCEIEIVNGKLLPNYNDGYIYVPDYEPTFSTTLEIDTRNYDLIDIIEIDNRFFETNDACELILTKDFIIFTDDGIFYSEEYLKKLGYSFYELEDVVDMTKMQKIVD